MRTQPISVAVGVVSDGDGHLLIARRFVDENQHEMWEFPGGKLEPGENAWQALCRELNEEINIEVVSAEPLIDVWHDYTSHSVLLNVWWVTDFSLEPKGMLGQPLRWVKLCELFDYTFPAANRAIVVAVQQHSNG